MRSLCSLSSQRAAARAAAGSRTRQRAAGWLDCWHCAPAPTFGRYYSDAIIDGGDEVDPSRGYEYQRHEIRARRHAALTERSGNLNATVADALERSGRPPEMSACGDLCSIYIPFYTKSIVYCIVVHVPPANLYRSSLTFIAGAGATFGPNGSRRRSPARRHRHARGQDRAGRGPSTGRSERPVAAVRCARLPRPFEVVDSHCRRSRTLAFACLA